MPKPTVKRVKIADLLPDPANPRKHPPESLNAVAASLKHFGAARSVVIDKEDIVRAGNATLEAAKQLGIKEAIIVEADGKELIVVRRPDWSKADAAGYAIADNRTQELSEWDLPNLQALLPNLSDELRDLIALTDKDLKDMLDDLPGAVEPSDGELLKKLKVTIADPQTDVKAGQQWKVGPHVLIITDVMRDATIWKPLLKDDWLFVPYPGPFVALAQLADEVSMLLVQPDCYVAGHLLDNYKAIYGAGSIKLLK